MAGVWEGGHGGWEAQARSSQVTKDHKVSSGWALVHPPSLSQVQGKTQTENTKDHKPGKTQKIPKCLCAGKVFLPKQRNQAGLKWLGGKERREQRISRTWLCWSWVRDEIDVHVDTDWVELTICSRSKFQKKGRRQNNMLRIKDCQYTFFISKYLLFRCARISWFHVVSHSFFFFSDFPIRSMIINDNRW